MTDEVKYQSWERVDDLDSTFRLAVPGGWLYQVERRTVDANGAPVASSTSVTFVPYAVVIPD